MKKLSKWQAITLKALYAMEFNDFGRHYDLNEICNFIERTFDITVSKPAVILSAIRKMDEYGFVVFKFDSFVGTRYRISVQGAAFAKEHLL